ncbi:MAG: organomercurial lyase [Candidatus Kariarchaeaceae archaeon]|jgi:hypothetical protein
MPEALSKQIRKYVYDYFHEFAIPPTLELILNKFDKKRDEILTVLYSLHEDHLLVVDKKINKILIAHPFAGVPTSYIVKPKREQSYYATCAWDSIAMHITLEEDIEIQAYCYHCNEPISLILEDEKIVSKNPDEVLIHFQYPAKEWWDDIIDTCYNTMNFFCSHNHLRKWIQSNPKKSGYYLNDEQIMDISILLYRNKMDLDYERPTTNDIRDRFQTNGLTGEFWEI